MKEPANNKYANYMAHVSNKLPNWLIFLNRLDMNGNGQDNFEKSKRS